MELKNLIKLYYNNISILIIAQAKKCLLTMQQFMKNYIASYEKHKPIQQLWNVIIAPHTNNAKNT